MEVYVRNAALDRIAILEEYRSLTMIERHLGVGNWVLQTSFHGDAVDALLREPGSGLEVRDDDGGVLFAGPVEEVSRQRDTADEVTFAGWDDNVWLDDREVLPQPLTADPSAWTLGYDVHSGVATTAVRSLVNVQAGPDALPERQVPRMILAPDPIQGPTSTLSARFGTIWDAIHPFCVLHGLTAHVRQVGERLVFSVYADRTRDSVVFAPDWGSLDTWNYKLRGPEATTVYVAGQGDLGEREIRHVTISPPRAWGRRVERLVDRRDVENPAELVAAGQTFLAENGPVASLAVTATGGDFRYRRDFDLGDLCTVVIDGTQWVERVTTVETTATATGVTHQITVGPEQVDGQAAIFAALRNHGSRIRTQEAK